MEYKINTKNVKKLRYFIKKKYINTLYNTWTYHIDNALLNNDCYIIKKYKPQIHKNKLLNKKINLLIKIYEKAIENKEKNPLLIKEIEFQLNIQIEKLLIQNENQFINEAKNYNQKNLQKQLYSHLNIKQNKDSIISYEDKTFISDVDIAANSINHFKDLYGNRKNIHHIKNINDLIKKIIEDSYSNDDNNDNKDFTSDELEDALKHNANNKSTGLDGKRYHLLKTMNNYKFLHNILLNIINKIYSFSIYPDQLNVSKTLLIKKYPLISTYQHLRGITITNNFKNIINYMMHKRNAKYYIKNINNNHAAYKKGIGCELTVLTLTTSINKLCFDNDKIYIAISDLDQAFDKVN